MNILPHPTLLQSRAAVEQFQANTGLRVVIIDGKPVVTDDAATA